MGTTRTNWKHALGACTLALAGAGWASTATGAVLLHHYDFSAGATDGVGGQDGVLVGNATVAGGVLSLDGNGDYVQFATHLVPLAGSFSVAMFGQRNADQGIYTEMISQGLSGGTGFYIGTRPDGNVRLGDAWIPAGLAFGAVGDLVHYALVVDAEANLSSFYMDGVFMASRVGVIPAGAGGTHTRLGRQFDPFNEFFRGILDDVRIYSGALTGGEVAALANPGNQVSEPPALALAALGLLALAKRRRAG